MQHSGQKQSEIRPGLSYQPLTLALSSDTEAVQKGPSKEEIDGKLRESIARILRDEADDKNGEQMKQSKKSKRAFRRRIRTVRGLPSHSFTFIDSSHFVI